MCCLYYSKEDQGRGPHTDEMVSVKVSNNCVHELQFYYDFKVKCTSFEMCT